MLLQPASKIPACYIKAAHPISLPFGTARNQTQRQQLYAQRGGSIPCMLPKSEMHMLKAARQRGPSSQEGKGE